MTGRAERFPSFFPSQLSYRQASYNRARDVATSVFSFCKRERKREKNEKEKVPSLLQRMAQNMANFNGFKMKIHLECPPKTASCIPRKTREHIILDYFRQLVVSRNVLARPWMRQIIFGHKIVFPFYDPHTTIMPPPPLLLVIATIQTRERDALTKKARIIDHCNDCLFPFLSFFLSFHASLTSLMQLRER